MPKKKRDLRPKSYISIEKPQCIRGYQVWAQKRKQKGLQTTIGTFYSTKIKKHYILVEGVYYCEVNHSEGYESKSNYMVPFDILKEKERGRINDKLYNRAKHFARKQSKKLKIKNIEDLTN